MSQDQTAARDREEFRQFLQKLTDFSPDPCGPPYGRESDWHSSDVESRVFERASDIVTRALNASPESQDNAIRELKKLEQISTEINGAWPEENRFHFQTLDIPPALVVKMKVRTHEIFYAFGIPEGEPGKPNRLWREIGWGNGSDERNVPQIRLDLYPLHKGSSESVRFLAKFDLSGCAGSLGVVYDAEEWRQHNTYLEQIIKQAGSFGLDDKVPGFPQIGELRTKSSLLTLPYCWFSAIDTWDNPSLCVVDTYDLSGDDVRFRSRIYNRPDLVPIAKAIEYAEQRDYPAVLGYCASPDLARRMVREIPSSVTAEDLRVTRTGQGKERVEMGGYRFDVEKREGRWLVVSFRAE